MKKTPVILLTATLLLTLSAFHAYAARSVTTGKLLLYSSQAEFETDYPGLPVEDFEESGVPDTGGLQFNSPLVVQQINHQRLYPETLFPVSIFNQ